MMEYEEFERIIEEDHEDYNDVTSSKIEDQDRWHTYYSKVVKQISTDKFFELYWGQGSTEMQDYGPENIHWEIYEVAPKQITKTIYEAVK